MKKIIQHPAFFHVGFWAALYAITFSASIRFDGSNSPFLFSLIITGTLVLPIYFHAYIFEKLFQQKKYYAYSIITLLLVTFFGYVNEQLLSFLLKGVESETYLTLFIFMAVFTGFKYLRIGGRQQFLLEQEEKKRIRAENELLRSQVNPHFMFNTLNSIYSLILAKDDHAGDSILKLSGLMRYMLDNSKKRMVSLKQECDFLSNYIDLEKIRLGRRCQVEFEWNGDLNAKSIAPMLLIPFIENAFKHGVSASIDKNQIVIQLGVNDDKLRFQVRNNIALRHNTLQKKAVKMGIENVTQRLELLYPNKHELHISYDNSIFEIVLKIDL